MRKVTTTRGVRPRQMTKREAREFAIRRAEMIRNSITHLARHDPLRRNTHGTRLLILDRCMILARWLNEHPDAATPAERIAMKEKANGLSDRHLSR